MKHTRAVQAIKEEALYLEDKYLASCLAVASSFQHTLSACLPLSLCVCVSVCVCLSACVVCVGRPVFFMWVYRLVHHRAFSTAIITAIVVATAAAH